MNRREFLGWVGVGSVASYFPVALAACYNPSNPDGFIEVGTLTDLQQKGQLSQGEILVVSLSSDSQENPAIIAVNPTCTHLGCTVDWEKNEKAFLCPCHASLFAPDGAVLEGPAEKPLATYITRLEGDKILVKTK
jgi:cytochrome b6-f complex iron-sulfur subunit